MLTPDWSTQTIRISDWIVYFKKSNIRKFCSNQKHSLVWDWSDQHVLTSLNMMDNNVQLVAIKPGILVQDDNTKYFPFLQHCCTWSVFSCQTLSRDNLILSLDIPAPVPHNSYFHIFLKLSSLLVEKDHTNLKMLLLIW